MKDAGCTFMKCDDFKDGICYFDAPYCKFRPEDKPVQKWQPIETAPKDGSHVLLYRMQIQFVGYYNSGWIINAAGLPPLHPEPTHWMPLPEPPKEAADGPTR